jgi:cysteine-rich repeat protein
MIYAEPPSGVLPFQMLGSDTLREVTRDVILTCQLENNIDYRGTGSTNGGNAMRTKDQQIAPQSRFLNSQECNDFGTAPQRGQGVTIGLDGIGVFGDGSEATTCNTIRYTGSLNVTERNGVAGVQCPNCSGTTYTFSDWRDVLRIVYTGQSAHISASACSDADPARIPSALGGVTPAGCGNGTVTAPEQCDDGNVANFDGCASNCTWEIGNANRCNSDLRRELVSTWGNLFQGGCGDPECTELRHAFRRDDASGTTDTFLTLLGLPAATSRTFCNGFEVEDLDPVRRPCDANEQVCATVPFADRNANPNGGAPTGIPINPAVPGGDLGLVLPITMPADTTLQYGEACALGKFQYAPMPFAATVDAQRCPDGNSRSFAKCRFPQTAASEYNCRAVQSTRPPIRTLINMDGRAYNLIPRNPATGEVLLTASGITDPRYGGGGWYRIHQVTPMANGTDFCDRPDATQQLGCLVFASPCSIAYAGREALFAGSAKAYNLRSPLSEAGYPAREIALEDVLIRRLMDPTGGTCGDGDGDNFGYRYPLARRLWINASRGFGTNYSNIFDTVDSNDADTTPDLNTRERMLVQCLADRELTDRAIVDWGFITLTENNCSAGNCLPEERDIGYRMRSCAAP